MSVRDQTIRVGIITSAPAPYRKGLFERLARRDDLELKVYFLGRTCGEWNWDAEIGGEFDHEYLDLPGYIPEKRYSMWVHPQIPGILRAGRFDAVVVGGYFIPSFLLTIAWCRRNNIPYILWSESHGGMRRSRVRRVLRSLIIEPVVRGAAAYLAVGSGAREYLSSLGAAPDRISILLNSPDVDKISEEVSRFRPMKEEWKKLRNLGNGPVGLFVGRMSPEKGLDDLLDAYSILARGVSTPPTLILVGRGELLDAVRERVRREGWSGVHIEGFVPPERITEYYAAADFLALPSRHEPFGAVVQEAMAAGLPVVASSAVGASADLIREGETGFVAPVGDPKGLAERLKSLWDDPGLSVRMGAQCQRMARQFDHGRGEMEFMTAIKQAINSHEEETS